MMRMRYIIWFIRRLVPWQIPNVLPYLGRSVCKNFLDVSARIENANNLRPLVSNPVEYDVRGGRERAYSGPQFVARSSRIWMILKERDYISDAADDLFRTTGAGRALVIIPNLIEITERFGRP
jgi:hypothetical protein